MLVLTRKNQESLVVGGVGAGNQKMIVTVLAIQGTKVRLGIEVPGGVPVHRREVWERIQRGELPGKPA